ncbi:hypothetical protein M9Y10_020412 [Tritrichomonas musculus]|uniref:RING-type domain-containing protein n=1 Tax=Tritrichomonas musculus TaxID=1915356 RepID=A0ABR2HG35_9EUKA
MDEQLLDFRSIFNEKNSIINEKAGEIIITSPKIELKGEYYIMYPSKFTSNCNTIIKTDGIFIISSNVSLSNLFFETYIVAENSSNFSISNCTIKNATSILAALTITDCKFGSISHITISGLTKQAGIVVNNNSFVKADNLLLYEISETLFVINTDSYVSITDSDFHHSSANGIHISNQSYLELTNSKFSHIAYPAIYVSKSRCSIKNNKFEDIDQNGISVHYGADLLIENNEFTNIQGSAISLLDESSGTIRENKIYKIHGNGVYCGNSVIKVHYNEFYDLIYPSIVVTNKSVARISNNNVEKVKYCGMASRGALDVIIAENVIKEVNEGGISISDTEKCLIESNQISDCSITGVECYNNSEVSLYDNVISNSKKYAFLAYTSGHIKAEKNVIKNVEKAMVKLAFKGGGDFLNNVVEKCPNQCECQTTSFYFFNGNGDFKGVTNDPSRNSPSIDLEKPFVQETILCLKCNKNPRDYYLLDCGHKVYCKQCAEQALKNNEECPLCRFPIVNVSNGFGVGNDDMCIICFDKKADSIILPCGHMGVCSDCLENWFKNKDSCPICRNEPSFYKKLGHDF